MKKLIPALCMLLVAACLMGTSTYAWFSANAAVEATGMQVKAVSTGGLVIASYKAGNTAPAAVDYVTSASVAWSNAEHEETIDGKATKVFGASLSPVSFSYTSATVEGVTTVTPKWVTTSSAAADTAEKDPTAAYTTVAADGTASAYYLYTKWMVKSLDESGAAHPLAVRSIEVESASTANSVDEALEKSLRVLVKVGDKYYKFAPNYATTINPSVAANEMYYTDGVDDEILDKDLITCGSAAQIDKAIGTVNNTGTLVEVYVYFEGVDANCMSKNAVDLNQISFVINFVDTSAT